MTKDAIMVNVGDDVIITTDPQVLKEAWKGVICVAGELRRPDETPTLLEPWPGHTRPLLGKTLKVLRTSNHGAVCVPKVDYKEGDNTDPEYIGETDPKTVWIALKAVQKVGHTGSPLTVEGMAEMLARVKGSQEVDEKKRKAEKEAKAAEVKRARVGHEPKDKRIAKLLDLFEKFGESDKPGRHEKITLPKELNEMINASVAWHSQEGSMDVEGLNLWIRNTKHQRDQEKIQIFGDKDLLEEQKKDKVSVCAKDQWTVLGATSESDYLFVNTDRSSKDFGATRLLLIEIPEDHLLTPAPFDNFLKAVEAWMEKWVAFRTKVDKDGKDWRDEIDDFDDACNHFRKLAKSS